MHKIKEKLMEDLREYEEKIKNMSGGRIPSSELQTIHMLTDTIKNIDKIQMYDEFSEDYDESFESGGSYRSGRRDRMGRYSRGGYSREGYSRNDGASYDGGSSYDDGGSSNRGRYSRGGGTRDHMIGKMEDILAMTENEEDRRAIQQCIKQIKNS